LRDNGKRESWHESTTQLYLIHAVSMRGAWIAVEPLEDPTFVIF